MAGYLAVVKYPVDADLKTKRKVLLEGLEMIAAELVAEHAFDVEQLERALENAQSFGEFELDTKREREATNAD